MSKDKKQIAILEDDSSLVKTLAEGLIAEGYEVSSAIDGETGLRLIEEKKPDLILLDIILPRKSGFEVMEELVKKEELKNIPVVVLTNLESDADVTRMMELGAKAFLVKANYSLDEVITKIKEILDKFEK